MAACQVNNGETTHAECSSITYPSTLIVWPTVANNLAHTVYELLRVIATTFNVNKTSYSTHSLLSFRIATMIVGRV